MRHRSSRPSRHLGTLLLALCLAPSSLAGSLLAGPPEEEPAATRTADEATKAAVGRAVKLLESADPKFRAGDFDAAATPTTDGMFHRVDFVRKAGSGEARRSVTIPVPPPETAATRDPALRPGLPAPKTEGADSDGKPVGLADLRGKAVVLVFCSPNCPPCKDFHGRAGELYKGLEGRSFAILEVMGADTVEAAREAARAADPPWPVLCDGEPDEDSIQARWKVEAYPTFWLIDPEGRIVAGPRLRPPVASEVEDLLRRAGMGLP